MSRQDANAAFARTSFLYGGNAAYIEDLYARYEADPASVDAEWQAFFAEPEGRAAPTSRKSAQRPVVAAAELAAARHAANSSRRSTATGREVEKAVGDKIKAKAQAQGRRDLRRRRAAGDARFDPRADADPRLPHARPSPRQSRSARARAAARIDEELDPRSYGFTEADLDRQIFLDKVLGLEFAHAARDPRHPARTYCQTLGVEFMHISDPAQKAWMQERIEGRDKEITFTREGKRAILNKLVEAEGFEKFCDLKFTGTKRFGLDGGESMIPALEQIIKRGGALGVKEIVIGMAHRGRLNVLSQVMGKPHRAIFHEFKGGSVDARRRRRLGRREISSRRLVGPRVRRQQGASVAHRQPVASRDRQSGGARQGARQAGPARRDAASDRAMVMPLLISRRRGLRRPGRDRRMLRPVRPARPPHRRLGAFHRQQPDRLHHLSALLALLALSVRRRQDDRGADLPRQRRRSGSGGVRRQGRDRVPAEIPEAGRHRHVLLSPLRPQRGRRAVVHPAADVQGDPRASDRRSRSTPRSWSARASSPRAKSRR